MDIIPDFLKSKAGAWAWNVAAKKVSVAVVKFIASAIIAHNVPGALAHVGVTATMDPDALQAAIFAGLVALHDWVKLKSGWEWL